MEYILIIIDYIDVKSHIRIHEISSTLLAYHTDTDFITKRKLGNTTRCASNYSSNRIKVYAKDSKDKYFIINLILGETN